MASFNQWFGLIWSPDRKCMHRIACRLFQRAGYLPIYATHVERSMVVKESIRVFQELSLVVC